MTTALFPGRFQPFHRGHRICVERILEAGRRVTVGIRTDVPIDADNPFTASQRYDIIAVAIKDLRCMIVELPTALPFDEIWSCNLDLARTFNCPVVELSRFGFSATQVRGRLRNEQPIDDLVCPGTARMIEQYFRRLELVL